MGGNAIKDSQRMSAGVLQSVKIQISRLLSRAISGIEFRFPEQLKDKDSFGDLDVIVGLTNEEEKKEFVTMLENHFSEIVQSGDVYSVRYVNYQVDFIAVDSDVDFANEYFSYGDLGNLLGYYAMERGLKLGHMGLYRSVNIPNVGKTRHVVTSDWREALDMIGFEDIEQPRGFASNKQMLDFVASSSLYGGRERIFNLASLNARQRSSIKKRPAQRQFFNEYLGYSNDAIDEDRSKKKKKASSR